MEERTSKRKNKLNRMGKVIKKRENEQKLDCLCDQNPKWVRVHVYFDRYSIY